MTDYLQSFAAAVRSMRDAQKRCHALRKREDVTSQQHQEAVKEARKREREVDGWLKAIEASREQKALFE